MAGLFSCSPAFQALAAGGDPVVYRVVTAAVPELPNQMGFATTSIAPGAVGDEFFMTRGHRHRVPTAAEVYLGLAGRGGLVLFDGEAVEWIEMSQGVVAHIAPGWAHRTVNVGAETFRFLAVYPADAGNDYEAVTRGGGMGATVVRSGGGYQVLDTRGRELFRRG
jgi:glucose-6-phosphate isomerase